MALNYHALTQAFTTRHVLTLPPESGISPMTNGVGHGRQMLPRPLAEALLQLAVSCQRPPSTSVRSWRRCRRRNVANLARKPD